MDEHHLFIASIVKLDATALFTLYKAACQQKMLVVLLFQIPGP